MKATTSSCFVLCALLAAGLATATHGQGIIADAEFTDVFNGNGTYTYTITLNNSASSSASIASFWFAWIPGGDLMDAYPTGLSAPPNWSATQNTGYYGGWSILYSTPTDFISPGGTQNFQFTSGDSPTTLSGYSPNYYYNYYLTGTSYVFDGSDATGNEYGFVATAATPEPSSWALLGLGTILFVGWRKFRTRHVPANR